MLLPRCVGDEAIRKRVPAAIYTMLSAATTTTTDTARRLFCLLQHGHRLLLKFLSVSVRLFYSLLSYDNNLRCAVFNHRPEAKHGVGGLCMCACVGESIHNIKRLKERKK